MGKALRVAVVCTVYNEGLLLPQFLRYYVPQVDHIFLIDNESTDGSLAHAQQCPNVEISTLRTDGEFRTAALCEARMRKKDECAGIFDYVLIVDVDEFVVPKCGKPLRRELEELWPVPILGTHGYGMWKSVWDDPYNPNMSLFHQRKWGIEDPVYSKPIIVRPEMKVDYVMGFHDTDAPNNHILKHPCISAFYLLHYVGVEESEYLRRGMDRTLRLSRENLESDEAWGKQYFGGTEEVYRERFREHQQSKAMVRLPI